MCKFYIILSLNKLNPKAESMERVLLLVIMMDLRYLLTDLTNNVIL